MSLHHVNSLPPSLERLSAQLLELGRLARSLPAAAFLAQGLEAVRALIGFRSAWWGLAVDADPQQPPTIYQSQLSSLPDNFTAAWLALAGEDEFGHAIRSRPGLVQRASDTGSVLPAAVHAFDQHYGIEHAMALALADASTGHGFFMCLYRGSDAPAFSDEEARCFSVLLSHLLQLWRFSLQDALQGQAVRELDSSSANAGGRLSPSRLRVSRLFAQGFSNKEIAQRLRLSPATVRTYLRDAYLELGVRNKVELGEALDREP